MTNDARSMQADALLGELDRQAGGRLTVFLGAAPGVGKTYAMLARARDAVRQGLDVVVGIAVFSLIHWLKSNFFGVERGFKRSSRKKGLLCPRVSPYRCQTVSSTWVWDWFR